MNFVKERIANNIVQRVGYKLENNIKSLLKFKNLKSRDKINILYLLELIELFFNIRS